MHLMCSVHKLTNPLHLLWASSIDQAEMHLMCSVHKLTNPLHLLWASSIEPFCTCMRYWEPDSFLLLFLSQPSSFSSSSILLLSLLSSLLLWLLLLLVSMLLRQCCYRTVETTVKRGSIAMRPVCVLQPETQCASLFTSMAVSVIGLCQSNKNK